MALGTTNLTMTDIGNYLNTNGGSVNVNNMGEFFTSAAKINKWSAHKPIRYAADFIAGADDKLTIPNTSSTQEWWKFDSCGLSLPRNTTCPLSFSPTPRGKPSRPTASGRRRRWRAR